MVDTYQTTTTKTAKVEVVKLKSFVRVVIYGGAVKASDNSAFKFASKNVVADYKNDLPVKNYFILNGANTVISVLETQQENSVQSLDLFCHGDPEGVYFIIGASLDKNVENPIKNQLASNIYVSKFQAVYKGFDRKENKMKNQYFLFYLSENTS